MEQRPLRLGDVVDDYCTRERRVTNHVIVALVEDAIRHTRCTTCDTEHAYKGAKEPRLRRKVVAGSAEAATGAEMNGVAHATSSADPPAPVSSSRDVPLAAAGPAGIDPEGADEGQTEPEIGNQSEAWVSHRRLIRATLPPTDEPPPPRPIPEFTMYQRPPARGARFRFRGGGNPNGNGNGNGNAGRGDGFGNGRPGQGQGQGSGRSGRHRGKRRPR